MTTKLHGVLMRARPPMQVAGVNYKVKVALNKGAQHAIVHAFKPLPHTGLPLDVKSAVIGDALD